MDYTTEKKDIRVTKTHRALTGALHALLKKRPFHKITVNDICETALVGRATFYAHFDDKYALLRHMLIEQRSALVRKCESRPRELIMATLDYLESNRQVYKNLFASDNGLELMDMMIAMFTEEFEGVVKRRLPQDDTGRPVDVHAAFLAGGVSSLMVRWLKSGFSGQRNYSKDEMADHLISLVNL